MHIVIQKINNKKRLNILGNFYVTLLIQGSNQSESSKFSANEFLVLLNLLFKTCELVGIG
jgi:hypothetical protein